MYQDPNEIIIMDQELINNIVNDANSRQEDMKNSSIPTIDNESISGETIHYFNFHTFAIEYLIHDRSIQFRNELLNQGFETFLATLFPSGKVKREILVNSKQKTTVALSDWEEKENFRVGVYTNNQEFAKEILILAGKYEVPQMEDFKANLLMTCQDGYYLMECKMTNPEINIEKNYNDDFVEAHAKISHLLKNRKSGLYLFHGPPGAGKTSYIKYLTKLLKDRKFIFIPSNAINDLESPQLTKVLYENPNSVLIMEDAEKAIVKRGAGGDSVVSSILNLSDGILGNILNTSIILSFNTDEKDLDPALLRRGRLAYKYKFNNLAKNKAQVLMDEQFPDKGIVCKGDMSLADIFNFESDGFVPEKAKLGFS
jgi:energy-coupling factor transporter ATP-binding protein EcfA2